MSAADPRIEAGFRLLRQRRWYDAHDAFESVWLEAEGEHRRFLQGLIHLAVSLEHLRRGNPKGALSQWRKAQARPARPAGLGCGHDVAAWRRALADFFAAIELEARATGVQRAALPAESEWPVPA